jgi:AcrR family transcriptional regulator
VTDGVERSPQTKQSRHKRAAIMRAALELFADEGYEATTVDQIAERSGVSRRTLFYYFPSKADILFAVPRETLDWLTTTVASQPLVMDDLAAIERAWTTFDFTEEVAGYSSRRRIEQLMKAAEGSVVLRGKQQESHLAHERALARGLAKRRGRRSPNPDMLLAAALGQTAMSVAIIAWVSKPSADPSATVAATFARARSILRA